MARTRQIVPLSYDPANPEAERVMYVLDATVPHGQRSATIWRWLAAYLDGRGAAQPSMPDEDADLDDALDSL